MMITLLSCLFTRLSTRSLGLPFYTWCKFMHLNLSPFPLTLQPLVSTISLSCFELIQHTSGIIHYWWLTGSGSQPKRIPPCVKKFERRLLPYHLSSLMCLRKILNLQMLQFFVTAVLKVTVMPLPERYIQVETMSYLLINPYTVWQVL